MLWSRAGDSRLLVDAVQQCGWRGEGFALIFLLCLQFLIFFSLVCSSPISAQYFLFLFFVGLAVLQHSLSQLGQQGRIRPIYVFLKMKKGCWWVGLGRDGGCLCVP